MAGRKRPSTRSSTRRNAASRGDGEPDIYQEMLAEAGVSRPEPASPERPLKRPRRAPTPGAKENAVAEPANTSSVVSKADKLAIAPAGASKTNEPAIAPPVPKIGDTDSDESEVEFQDVVLPPPTVQTMERDSDSDDDDDDDDEDGIAFEDVDFGALPKEDDTASQLQQLELNLTAQKAAASSAKKTPERRKPITREEKDRRLDVHKAHLVCLLSHMARRNHWCNDVDVQERLRQHLSGKMTKYLTPSRQLPQFGQAESLKTGLQQMETMWRSKFEVTERGLRRALWAEDVAQLKDYEPPSQMDSCLDRNDFRAAAETLQGSRDVGAQLYCALLRSAGVRARLICSLQPLSCSSSAPSMPKPKASSQKTPTKSRAAKAEAARASMAVYEDLAKSAAPAPGAPTARRRLGHPNAMAYNFEPVASPPKARPTFHGPKQIRESSYPVYWVEVLDFGHQKWQPADPLVTRTFWKPRVLEPPIHDKENSMSYVVAFDADGTAKDVTRRYAKAYTAKTRKLRIDGTRDGSDRWWRKAMKPFRTPLPGDLDQIEDIELAAVESREPMPRNVQDFKDHPIYALERHLRRHEVLVPGAMPSGTVGAGSKGPLEKIYRRRDVRATRSADKWYRMGREVKPNEIPAKWLPKKARPKRARFGFDGDRDDDEDDDPAASAGTPTYTVEQTELFEPPPVRNGKVPKNKFGNVDAHVPSMIPRGGAHIVHELAARAAFLLGIDYAPALTGFQFRGRQGTAVLSGVVVAAESEAAVRAVIEGLLDAEQEAEEQRRRAVALKMWRRMLMALRIRERVWAGVDEGERQEAERRVDEEMEAAESDVTEELDMAADDDEDMGGGFMVE